LLSEVALDEPLVVIAPGRLLTGRQDNPVRAVTSARRIFLGQPLRGRRAG
jgi:hypothetical protein